ncbi:GTP pyrophosphokinase family protein [Microbacterium sp. RURRCA19A]|uniref:GTP pyrophosphokinase n=1 Tax=Microbacterium sp. RURRCA19A TaxID=1907391 RepID=UPI0009553A1E|nr:RelA/SpoT domain-containing protein [Microbacterium sp. RURRCA19A]SIR74740.1 ppGpp synthetase catalytic domain-containing protein (RelA/SpoT-type nucleotidyltranferase) [Microbacterium sp. RURRCA19A]
MGVIDEFLDEYDREFDYWEAAGSLARTLLEAELSSSGLRAIVTSRAKSLSRLRAKIESRNRENIYVSTDAIRADIVDLAGVRVALYFPGQMAEVERAVRALFAVDSEKSFPDPLAPPDPRSPRFSGYGAKHFRVRVPEARLSEGAERYASALIEVQVASVLMHAWSEVEHDLVYKPYGGDLSGPEYALLDQLNGLVLSGEIALEQLQRATDARLASSATPFQDHYELAEFLRARLAPLAGEFTDAALGRVDILFGFLLEENLATIASVEPYLDSMEEDFQQRPVAEQLADLMLTGDRDRYDAYLRASKSTRQPSSSRRRSREDDHQSSGSVETLGEFVAAWAALESRLRSLARHDGPRILSLPSIIRELAEHDVLPESQVSELHRLRRLRNDVFHGAAQDLPDEELRHATNSVREVIANLPAP